MAREEDLLDDAAGLDRRDRRLRSALAVPIASMPGVQVTGSTSMVETVTGGGWHAGEEAGDHLVAEQVEADDAADDDDEQHDGQQQSPDHQ